MKADELYELAINTVNSITTDEDRYDHADIHGKLMSAIARAREIWIKQNGGRIPYQWLLTEELNFECSEQWDEHEESGSCYVRFKMPDFLNIGSSGAFSITYPNGDPYNYIAYSWSQFKDWETHSFFKGQDILFIHDRILHVRSKTRLTTNDSLIITGIPYDPEQLSTFNPMWDDYPVTPDIVDYAIDKIFKPLVYASQKPIDTVSSGKDNNVQQISK